MGMVYSLTNIARPYSKSLFNHEEHEVHEGIWEK